VVECKAKITLVYPDWKDEPWMALLQTLRLGEERPVDLQHFSAGPSEHCEPHGNRGTQYAAAHRRMRLAFLDGARALTPRH